MESGKWNWRDGNQHQSNMCGSNMDGGKKVVKANEPPQKDLEDNLRDGSEDRILYLIALIIAEFIMNSED